VARAPPVVAAPIGNRTQRRPAHERPGASAQLPRAAAQHVDAQRCPKRWTTPRCFDPRTRCGRCSERTGGKATGATERRTSRANAFASSNLTCSPVTAEPAAMASAEPNPVDEQHAIGVAARGTAHLSGAHGRLAGRDEAERACGPTILKADAIRPGAIGPLTRPQKRSSAETEGPSLPLEAARRGRLWSAPVLPSVNYQPGDAPCWEDSARRPDSASALRVCCGARPTGWFCNAAAPFRVG
jgi:hypothetical protein